MSLSWGWPLAFAGLAALIVPVLLHLDRRRSVQVLRFAALRWIVAQARPRRTWRVVEWLLLALRLLLVAVLVAWLAQPWLRGLPREPVHWIAVVPGAAGLPAGEAAANAVWLAPGFPSVAAPAPSSEGASVSSLLREFDARIGRDDTLEVRVPEVLHGLDAAAIALSRDVRWVVAGDAAPPAPAAPRKRTLALRYAPGSESALRHVRAALRAWQASPEFAVDVDEGALGEPVPATADAVLRIAAGSADTAVSGVPRTTASGSGTPRAAASVSGSPHAFASMAQRGDARRTLDLDATTLDPAQLQSAGFPRWLHRELFGAPPPPDQAFAAQVAPLASAAPVEPQAMSLQAWLARFAAALFLLERVLANGRRLARPA